MKIISESSVNDWFTQVRCKDSCGTLFEVNVNDVYCYTIYCRPDVIQCIKADCPTCGKPCDIESANKIPNYIKKSFQRKEDVIW